MWEKFQEVFLKKGISHNSSSCGDWPFKSNMGRSCAISQRPLPLLFWSDMLSATLPVTSPGIGPTHACKRHCSLKFCWSCLVCQPAPKRFCCCLVSSLLDKSKERLWSTQACTSWAQDTLLSTVHCPLSTASGEITREDSQTHTQWRVS